MQLSSPHTLYTHSGAEQKLDTDAPKNKWLTLITNRDGTPYAPDKIGLCHTG
jgi:hypothetical protein